MFCLSAGDYNVVLLPTKLFFCLFEEISIVARKYLILLILASLKILMIKVEISLELSSYHTYFFI